MGPTVAIVGSENFNEMQSVVQLVRHLANTQDNLSIISGGRQGVDAVALTEAKNIGIPTLVLNKSSEYLDGQPIIHRDDEDILDSCDIIYVFWNGESDPEQKIIKKAVKYGHDHEILLESQENWDAAMQTINEAESTVVADDDADFVREGLADGRDFEDLK